MSRIFRRRPSPSMIVALVALFVALAGTATALPGRARVKKDDISRAAVRSVHIKSRAILSKHIKSRAVTRSKIAKRAISSSEVGQDALTGTNIVESSLGTVPTASNATNATNAGNAATVNGRTVEKMSFLVPGGTGPTTVLSLNGLTLVATCGGGPALSVVANTSVGGALIHSGGNHTTTGSSHYNADDSFNPGESFDVLRGSVTGGSDVEGTLTYVRSDGVVVTATYLAEEDPPGNRCIFGGMATG
jgi:hypothetical protein